MIRWMWAFVDRPLGAFEAAAGFWTGVTGTTLSPRRGARAEFATLLPPDGAGDACLKIQGVLAGGGAHLDLEVDDLAAATERLTELGGRVVSGSVPGLVVAESPGCFRFCLTVHHGAATRPRPAPTADGAATSRLDQVCLDIAPANFDREVAFWADLTTWDAHPGRFPEFHYLDAPPEIPVRILFQRLGEAPAPTPGATPRTTAHLDFACSDVPAVRRDHEARGATHVADGPVWTVMRDPQGGVYCLTQRDPLTGRLPARTR